MGFRRSVSWPRRRSEERLAVRPRARSNERPRPRDAWPFGLRFGRAVGASTEPPGTLFSLLLPPTAQNRNETSIPYRARALGRKRLVHEGLQLREMLRHQPRRGGRRGGAPGIGDSLDLQARLAQHPFHI